MEKVYKYKNAIICVRSLDTYDRENLKKATSDFLKKVINGGKQIGNSDTSGDFREEQILHR